MVLGTAIEGEKINENQKIPGSPSPGLGNLKNNDIYSSGKPTLKSFSTGYEQRMVRKQSSTKTHFPKITLLISGGREVKGARCVFYRCEAPKVWVLTK